jgi:predicted DNA-binding transcriptional regulator YafY
MLRVRYRRSGDAAPPARTLAPLGLVLKGGVWYLVARGGERIRTYRAARIYDATICDETFERPEDFDLAAHWEATARDYEAGIYREFAVVRLSRRGLALLDLLGPHVVEAAARTRGKPDRAGWVRCTLPIESFEMGVRELMRLGGDVNVIGPPALRSQLAESAARVVAVHAAGAASRKNRI